MVSSKHSSLSGEESTRTNNSCGSSVEGITILLNVDPTTWGNLHAIEMFKGQPQRAQMEFLLQLGVWPISGKSLEALVNVSEKVKELSSQTYDLHLIKEMV